MPSADRAWGACLLVASVAFTALALPLLTVPAIAAVTATRALRHRGSPTRDGARGYFPRATRTAARMAGPRSQVSIWFIVSLVALAVFFVPIGIMPTWTGVVIGFVLAIAVALLGFAWQARSDGAEHTRRTH